MVTRTHFSPLFAKGGGAGAFAARDLGLVVLLTVFVCASCRRQETPPRRLPDEAAYGSETNLMYKICNKFVEETDNKRLHRVAVDTQTLGFFRECANFNNECTLYNGLLAEIIKASAGDSLSAADRIRLRAELARLKKAIETGKLKLHKEWEKERKK